ncbi:MAG TPA: UTP--glucose-1-phosphate uridylyltransferase [Clostridiales bacterium]|nr:MAG: UTP--glucose-1-phosphate uridylyltransferase [Clostridiales bacterium GWD2_32_59]HAN09410.1 UTP--glucose-1-phosphate uridylyltransferase [Clostridiales bacterium]
MKVTKAVIPAAGFGTRFLPATKAQPKEMLPIVDKPAIQYIVEEIVKSGIKDILIITGRGKHAIEDHFDKSYELEEELRKSERRDLLEIVENVSNMVNINYIRQGEAKGLGHAVYCAKSFVGDEPFALLLGDDVVDSEVPCIKQLIDIYEKYDRTIVGVQKVERKQVSKCGIVDGDMVSEKLHLVKDMIEKPSIEEAPSDIAILGRYVLSSKIFGYLENTKPGKNGEIQLTDAIQKLSEEEEVYAYEFEGKRYDIGSKVGYLKATIEFALKRADINREFIKYLFTLAEEKGIEYKRKAGKPKGK